MPRKPRFFLPDVPVHIVQRGHRHEPVFFEDSDYQVYLGWLLEAAEHSLYTEIGGTKVTRYENYKGLFKTYIDDEQLQSIRAAWQTGTPLGNSYFQEKIERKLKTKVGQARRGRPSGSLKGRAPFRACRFVAGYAR